MRTVSYRLVDLIRATINLGFAGENEHTQVVFDGKRVFDDYPNAVASLTVKPPVGETYPAVTTRDGNLITWVVTNSDLIYEGHGEIQLAFEENGVVVKSYIAKTSISRSIIPTGEVPTPIQNWLDEANQTLAEVEEAKQAFPAGGTTGQVLTKKSDEDYDTEWQTPQGGGGGTSNYNDLDNKPSINGVTLSGNKSLSDLSIPSQEDVDAKYTKPQGGIPASDIDPSAIPSPTSIIDDNAGEGDTDKVLSADKVTEITTGLSEAIATKQDEITNALLLPAGSSEALSRRVKVGSAFDNVVSILPYKSSGYTQVSIAHTKENLITTPYSSNSTTNLGGLSCSPNNDENKLTISGTKNVSYGYQYYFNNDLDNLSPGNYVFCAVGKFNYLNGTNGTTKLFWKQGNTEIKTAEKCETFPIYEMSFDSAISDVSAYVNVYGTYELDSEFYPLMGRGEKLSKQFETTIYGGEFNWITGVLVSKYNSAGEELAEPVEYELGGTTIEEYEENWFYSDSGYVQVNVPATLGELIDEAGQTVFVETLTDLRSADVSTLQSVITLGYYEKNDGGGAIYKIRSKQESDTDNGGTIIVIGNYVAEMIVERTGTVNVRQFGAKGDGLTNDVTAFTNALASADHVVVPGGTYKISSAIVVANGKWIDIDHNTTIVPGGDNGIFIMRGNTRLTGGLFYTYSQNSYTSSVVKITNDSSADLENVTISGTRFRGKATGKAIEFDSTLSQVLYCNIDNVQTYGYQYVVYLNLTNYSITGLRIFIKSNYASCVIYGATSGSYINVYGETGLENESTNSTVTINGGGYNTIVFEMVDVGNPGHLPYGVILDNNTIGNVVLGIAQEMRKSVIDNGFNNFVPLAQRDNNARTGYGVSNHRYNNILLNAVEKYSATVTLENCTISEDIDNTTYSASEFINTIADIVPTKSWKLTATDDTDDASATIEIENINIIPSVLSYEWDKRVGYGFGVGINKIQLYGKETENGEYTLLASKEYDRELALTNDIGSEIDAYTYTRTQYRDIKIVLTFKKSTTYSGVAYIRALGLFGDISDKHQAFVQSNGSTVYGDIEYVAGTGTVLTSPNGTKFRIEVANDGTLSTSELN